MTEVLFFNLFSHLWLVLHHICLFTSTGFIPVQQDKHRKAAANSDRKVDKHRSEQGGDEDDLSPKTKAGPGNFSRRVSSLIF